MAKFYDHMIDIETTGVQPNRTAMIQLAAVKFNLKERTVDSTNMFNRCLSIPNNRFWQEGTRQFWLGNSNNQKVLNTIYPRMENPVDVLNAFVDWAVDGHDSQEPLRFWAKPTCFDYSFVQSYLDDYDIPNPYHFRFSTDMNSYIRGLAGDPSMATFSVESKGGDAHDAIMDALNQINTLFMAADHYAAKAV